MQLPLPGVKTPGRRVQAEAAARQLRHIENLIKNSRLPYPLKLLADFDFDFQPKLNRKLINDLNAGVYEKTLDKRMRKYINPELLIIDEMGHDRLELQVIKEAHLLFKVIDQRDPGSYFPPLGYCKNKGSQLP